MKLSAHFDLSEFTTSQTAARLGIDNSPPPKVLEELGYTASLLEKVRAILGRPILVSSGYRSPEVNRAVGGAAGSAHLTGMAADFTCPGFGPPLEICRALVKHAGELGYDQLIHEFGAWVHIGRAPDPRRQVLTIDASGTRWGLA